MRKGHFDASMTGGHLKGIVFYSQSIYLDGKHVDSVKYHT